MVRLVNTPRNGTLNVYDKNGSSIHFGVKLRLLNEEELNKVSNLLDCYDCYLFRFCDKENLYGIGKTKMRFYHTTHESIKISYSTNVTEVLVNRSLVEYLIKEGILRYEGNY